MKLLLALIVVATVVEGLLHAPASAHGIRGGSGVVVSKRSPTPSHVHKGSPSVKGSFPATVDSWRSWPSTDVFMRHFGFDRGPHGFDRHHHGFHKHHHGFDRHHHFSSPFFSGFIGAPSVAVTTLSVVDGYAPTPVTYLPVPIASAPAPVVFPTPTVIEYSTGWYQLRGDGLTSPYTWVWIPKAPAVPPPPEPAPLVVPAPESSLPAEPLARAERGPAFHFTDDRGVTTWTNRLDRVPRRFRDQAAASVEPE